MVHVRHKTVQQYLPSQDLGDRIAAIAAAKNKFKVKKFNHKMLVISSLALAMIGGLFLALTDSLQVKERFSLKSIKPCADAIAAREPIKLYIEKYGEGLDSFNVQVDDIDDNKADRNEEDHHINIAEQSTAMDLKKVRESQPLDVLIAEYKKQDEACLIAITKQIQDKEAFQQDKTALQNILDIMQRRSNGFYRVLKAFQKDQEMHAFRYETIKDR